MVPRVPSRDVDGSAIDRVGNATAPSRRECCKLTLESIAATLAPVGDSIALRIDDPSGNRESGETLFFGKVLT